MCLAVLERNEFSVLVLRSGQRVVNGPGQCAVNESFVWRYGVSGVVGWGNDPSGLPGGAKRIGHTVMSQETGPAAHDRSQEVIPIRGAGIFGSTISEMFFRRLGVDPMQHDRNELLRVMTAVKESYDALERMKRSGYHGTGPDTYANRKHRIVEYLRDGGFISDLHEDDEASIMGVLMTWDETITTLAKKTNASKVSRVWLMDQLAWYRLEQAVDLDERPGRALAREIGVGLSTCQNLYGMYEQAGRVGAKRLPF